MEDLKNIDIEAAEVAVTMAAKLHAIDVRKDFRRKKDDAPFNAVRDSKGIYLFAGMS